MAKEDKAKVQRWIRQGIASLPAADMFLTEFGHYAYRVGNASLLAMTGEEARQLLDFYNTHGGSDRHVGTKEMLRRRIEICELQGDYSLQRKRELKEQRSAT